MFKKIGFFVSIIVISGISGIVADRYIFPRLATTKFFSKYEFLKKSTERVTVINKTEQVYIKEDSSVAKITNQVASAIVNIVSYDEKTFDNLTGQIMTSDGLIMTYATEDMSKKYKVMTREGNVYDGELVGVDSWSNLAFIKINANNLPVISLANSDEYSPGEKIISIGNDMREYQNKFSAGILNSFDPTFNISGESLSTAEKVEGVFLSDFNKEKLSVGGPIINHSGQVIGVTGSVLKNGVLEYFQIPSNKIKDVLDKTIKNELDTNPIFGVYYMPITKSYALTKNLSVDHGAMIYSKSGQQGLAVIYGTPAAKADLRINDIVTKIGEEEIGLKSNFSGILYKYKKGDTVELTVLRDGNEIKMSIQI